MIKNCFILGFLAVLLACNSNTRGDWAALAEETQTEVVDTGQKEYVLPLSVDKIDFEVLTPYFRYRDVENLEFVLSRLDSAYLYKEHLLKVDLGKDKIQTPNMAESAILFDEVFLLGSLKTSTDMPKVLIFLNYQESWCQSVLLASIGGDKKAIAFHNAFSSCGDAGDFVDPYVKKVDQYRYLSSHIWGENFLSNGTHDTTQYNIKEGYFSILKNGIFKEVVTRVDSNLYEINVIKQ
jgi:hypothetical protein